MMTSGLSCNDSRNENDAASDRETYDDQKNAATTDVKTPDDADVVNGTDGSSNAYLSNGTASGCPSNASCLSYSSYANDASTSILIWNSNPTN